MSKAQLLPSISFDQTDNGPKIRTISPQDFRSLDDRIKTFDHWPNLSISKVKLAEAGFIYTGKDDIVICPFCKVEGFRWFAEDNPMADHREWTPHCPFIRNNVDSSEQTNGSDTCGPFIDKYGIEVVPNSVPEDKKYDLQRLGVHKNVNAQYPEKFLYETRLETFDKWPKAIKQRPADLAEAGFFYTGVGDQTLCFHCGGGLKDWEENDDPWEQHALWFSKCVYLNLKKGPEFISKVKKEYEPVEAGMSGTNNETKEEPTPEASLSEKCEKFNLREAEASEKTLCKICFKNELGVVFLPCGHIVACVDCAAALKTCAVCRKPLEATVRAFLS